MMMQSYVDWSGTRGSVICPDEAIGPSSPRALRHGVRPAAAADEFSFPASGRQWVLTSTIGRKQTTHDVDANLVLKDGYVQVHEVSREKDATGAPQKVTPFARLTWTRASATKQSSRRSPNRR